MADKKNEEFNIKLKESLKGTEQKHIDVVTMKVGDLKTTFGNPRKIGKKKREELKNSMMMFGDFGMFIINEENELIAGHQRASILKEVDGNIEVTCKRLVGYSNAELRAINIKDNTHSGEWDMDLLADWTADLNMDFGIKDAPKKEIEDRSIKEMELIHYEKYDYVMIVCRNELDYNNLVRALGIEGAKVRISKRKINARAIWYDKMKAKIVPLEESIEETNKKFLEEQKKKLGIEDETAGETDE